MFANLIQRLLDARLLVFGDFVIQALDDKSRFKFLFAITLFCDIDKKALERIYDVVSLFWFDGVFQWYKSRTHCFNSLLLNFIQVR